MADVDLLFRKTARFIPTNIDSFAGIPAEQTTAHIDLYTILWINSNLTSGLQMADNNLPQRKRKEICNKERTGVMSCCHYGRKRAEIVGDGMFIAF